MEFTPLTDPADGRLPEALALYAQSFPLHEQRQAQSQRDILAHPDYRFDLLYDDGSFVGLLLYWETADFAYVEHFCTLPALRGRGLGAQALEQLARRGKTVVLEIDPPVDALSLRRRGFYLRAGFCENAFAHVHPPYREEFSGHELVVLSRPRPLTETEYRRFAAYLQSTVMGL